MEGRRRAQHHSLPPGGKEDAGIGTAVLVNLLKRQAVLDSTSATLTGSVLTEASATTRCFSVGNIFRFHPFEVKSGETYAGRKSNKQ